MPRNCGCSGASCACRIVSNDGSIIVRGSGSAQNPYDLSAGSIGLAGRLQVQDTDTVDLVLTGAGSVGDPFTLTANATLDLGELEDVDTSNTTVGYVVARDAGGGFVMVPPSTAEVGAIDVGTGLTGDGSSGNPLTVADWPNIARLDASPDSPNLQWLTVGALDDESVYGYRVQRKNQDVESVDSTAAEFRLYDYGDGLGAALVLLEDSVESARMRLDRNGSIVVTGADGVSQRIPWRTVIQGTTVTFSSDVEAFTDVVFPVGTFTATPRVIGSINHPSTLGSARLLLTSFALIDNVGMRVYARHVNGTQITGSFTVAWQATQYGP